MTAKNLTINDNTLTYICILNYTQLGLDNHVATSKFLELKYTSHLCILIRQITRYFGTA